MPTTTYLSNTYITPFDPAYVDLWGAPINAVAVTTSHTSTTATGANTMVAGDDLTLTLSSVSGASILYYSYIIDRTGVGSA